MILHIRKKMDLKLSLFISLLIVCSATKAQVNLVSNPDFELYTNCPEDASAIGADSDFFVSVSEWMKPTSGSSDYFNECFEEEGFDISVDVPYNDFTDFQSARSGVAYCGFYEYYSIVEYREYIQTKLREPLFADSCYYVELYVNPAFIADELSDENHFLTTDRLGVYFSTDRIIDTSSYAPLNVIPQIENIASHFFNDTLGWEKISGIFEASGGEQWITIGNFYSDEETDIMMVTGDTIYSSVYQAYLFVDDVAVFKISCQTDTITEISNNTAEIIKMFSNPANHSIMISNLPEGINYQIYLYNLSGNLLTTRHLSSVNNQIFLDMTYGIFLASIRNEAGTIILSQLITL